MGIWDPNGAWTMQSTAWAEALKGAQTKSTEAEKAEAKKALELVFDDAEAVALKG